MKKILIILIACMFIVSLLPSVVGEKEANADSFKERKFIETRKIVPVYTENGLEKIPVKGKPSYYVTITSPTDGADVSGTTTITLDSNFNPSIYIDGVFIAKGLSYSWDTTAYSDGEHTIFVDAKGATDDVTVIVNNGGGGPTNIPPVADFTYDASNLAVDFFDDSSDSDGTVEEWYWSFGDGATSTQQNPSHTYAGADTYTVSLTVTDNEGATGSTSQDVTVTSGSSGGDGIVKKYALVIGISNYEGTVNDLQYCDDDADDWAFFLDKKGYDVTILKDEAATADAIVAAVDNLLDLEDGDDYVAFTYSGHGYKAPGGGSSIISQDLYYITHGWFEQRFASSDSPHIYFTFDACVIGGFDGLIDNNKVGAFASNRASSYDGDSSMKNGVYTYYQMLGWQSFDNFEEDGTYAAQMLISWASTHRLRADPFLVDMFDGPMLP